MVFATSRLAGSAVVLDEVLVYVSMVGRRRGSEHEITEPRIGPLETISAESSSQQSGRYVLRLVLFLYMMRCPHSLQRIGSRDLISFLTPQSKAYSVKYKLLGLQVVRTSTQILHLLAGRRNECSTLLRSGIRACCPRLLSVHGGREQKRTLRKPEKSACDQRIPTAALHPPVC